ncbi:DUF7261 family protein [Natronomonas amylolytica]|uniref:DUF7261 family protein n=1 Tax=Natronomonas amylolytica TaxID=3108498 RepID=UPI00300BED77
MLGDRPADERGQLLIITALALAIILVGLALVLNSAIYTENLSTRQSTDSAEVTTTLGGGEAEVQRAIRHVNRHNNASHDEANRAFDDIVSDIGNSTTDQHAKRGAAYQFTVTDRTNGTHLKHTNSSKSFVAGGTNSGQGNWTLARDIPKLRGYTIATQRGFLHEGSESDFGTLVNQTFRIRFQGEDAGGNSVVWEVYIYHESSDDDVTVFGGQEAEIDGASGFDDLTKDSCSVDVATDTEEVVVNITNNTVNGDDCEALSFEEVLDSAVDIRYENADDDDSGSRSGGTYELAIGTTSYEDQYFHDASDDQSPYATNIIYDARVESHYSRDDITHSRVVRVHPGTEVDTS